MAGQDGLKRYGYLSLDTTNAMTATNLSTGISSNSSEHFTNVPITPSASLPQSAIGDSIDISHVQLKSPKSASRPFRFSEASFKLADTLGLSLPVKPSKSYRSNRRSSNGGSYEALSPTESPGRELESRRKSMKSYQNPVRRKPMVSELDEVTIGETEEIYMGLLRSAARFGEGQVHTSLKVREEDEDELIGYDISSLTFGGLSQDEQPYEPHIPKTSPLREETQLLEAKGKLTGGLGVAKALPEIPSSELEAEADTQSPRLSRRLTRMRRLSRNPTMKDLGQCLADKRGEAIKVVMNESPPPLPVDISSFAGEGAPHFDPNEPLRNPTFISANTIPRIEIFYPTANWKPFSMRWPYLTALIVISIILAIAQEYLYHKSSLKAKLNPSQGLYTFKRPQDLNTWSYFSFKYLPTMIAVTFGVLWQFTDNEVKRLEAYYQLSTPKGALAAETINVDYITFINILRPLRALRYKHLAVFESSLATLLAATLVPPLQAASIVLDPPKNQRLATPDGEKYIRISPVWSRFLSAVLFAIAILGCLLLRRLQTRHSGLMADVHGIAGVAAMANKSHILVDFKDMDIATPEIIHKKLRNRRYELRDSSLISSDEYRMTDEEIHKYDQFQNPGNPHPLMLRLNAGIPFVCFMLFCLMFLPIVLFTNASVITNNQSWFITALAVVIKMIWTSLETDMRMLEPFFILSRRHAPPSVLTMDYTGIAWGWMPIRAFLNGHFLLCLVGIGSILSEILTVSVTSFSGVNGNDFVAPPPPSAEQGLGPRNSTDNTNLNRNAGEETFTSFWVSFGLAISILVYLCLIASLIYIRRRHPFLPRQPNTIASILAFIHQSRMLYDFVDTQKLDYGEMVGLLEGLRDGAGRGKGYGLGWFVGRDGETHCGVDEEELMFGYRHGSDVRAAVQTTGVGTWATY